MTNTISNFFHYFFHILIEIAPVFFVAIIAAAFIDEYLPDDYIDRFFKNANFITIFNASLIGSLIPICTCGMIPLAYKLCKKGLDWKIIVAFLSAGNACSVAALWLSFFVLGAEITIYRFIVAVSFGILVVYALSLLVPKDFKLEVKENSCSSHSCENDSHHHHEHHSTNRLLNVWIDLKSIFISFAPWLLFAILVASIFHGYFGDISESLANEFQLLDPNSSISTFGAPVIATLVGFPFYFCAGTDVPISKELMLAGISSGTIISFMTASPGINFTSFIVYKQCVGVKKAMIFTAASILVVALLGITLNIFRI